VVHDLKAYKILINDKPYVIELIKHVGGPFSAKVNNKSYAVEVESIDYEASFSVKMDEKSYTVELKEVEKNAPFLVKVNNVPFNAKLETPARQIPFKISDPLVSVVTKETVKKTVGEGAVTAPMAGKIVSVKVKEGDSVKLGEVLCVLEAMKMENEITAPKTGLVQKVMIAEGMPVSEGTVLVVIK